MTECQMCKEPAIVKMRYLAHEWDDVATWREFTVCSTHGKEVWGKISQPFRDTAIMSKVNE